jgi:diacylglycerol kinase (ATP)
VNPALRRVALIYNPASGQSFAPRREAQVREAMRVLREAGSEVDSLETRGPGDGAAHARDCVRQGYGAVIACGGDGTVHEVLQPLVGTGVALGVLPLGTANALAANLGLIAPARQVADKLLQSTPVRIPVGLIHYQDTAGNPASRYFVVAAGIGADALLMSRMDSRLKRRIGYLLYLIEAFRLWATDPFPLFEAEVTVNGSGVRRGMEVSQLLAVRVRSFGGALRRLAPGATLYNGHLHLIAFRTRRRLHYLQFLVAVLAGRHSFGGVVELLEATAVECRPCPGASGTLFTEADGEVLGSLPVRLEVVPDALNLLIPPGAQP